jgi:predicted Fe-S protein YdhL (DUF1289 family)
VTQDVTIASPCVGICELDRTGQHCLGCGRTLDEIARWANASETEKLAILERLSKTISR